MKLGRLVPSAAVMLVGLLVVISALVMSDGQYAEYEVPAATSMSPTFADGSRITVRTDTTNDLRRGDVVLIKPESWPGSTDTPVVKRVVGLGGDRVSGAEDGSIEVNGHAIDEDYVGRDSTGGEGSPMFEVTVPDNTVFVAGDLRNNSLDSRWFADADSEGTFPPAAVLGTVVAVDGEAVAPTTAFTDAGLSGAAYRDTRIGETRMLVLIGGAVIAIGGLAWLAFTLMHRRAEAVPGFGVTGPVTETV
jgi:signal peptidase I